MFSPSYAARCRRGPRPLPREHTAVNLSLYRSFKRVAWVMSEYPGRERITDGRIRIADSAITWQQDRVHVAIRERGAPFHERIEGEIELVPTAPPFAPVSIRGRSAMHGWQVHAPRARLSARFSRPDFAFDGDGYHDGNWGEERLDEGFSRWGWARFHGERGTTIVYSILGRDGTRKALVARAPDGERGIPIEVEPTAEAPRRHVGWGLDLPRSFGAGDLTVEPTTLLEVAPFYARYRARLAAGGQGGAGDDGNGVGEFLDLDRFRHRGYQFLLRYRMRGAWRF